MGKAYDWEMEKFRVNLIVNLLRCKRNSLIKATREDSSRISLDSLSIQSDMLIGRPSRSDSLKEE